MMIIKSSVMTDGLEKIQFIGHDRRITIASKDDVEYVIQDYNKSMA